MGLSLAERRSRVAFDWDVLGRMRAATLPELRPYRSTAALREGRELSAAEACAGLAECVVARFRFPVLSGPDVRMPGAEVVFDLGAAGDYPFSPPLVAVLSRPLPWNAHVSDSGTVCIGGGWAEAGGRMLLAQLVVHVMRVFNCDQPASGSHAGYRPDAARFARNRLGGRPLTPGLVYPSLPGDVSHGVAAPAGGFTAVGVRPARPADGNLAAAPFRVLGVRP